MLSIANIKMNKTKFPSPQRVGGLVYGEAKIKRQYHMISDKNGTLKKNILFVFLIWQRGYKSGKQRQAAQLHSADSLFVI